MANLFRCGGGRSEASYQNLMDQLIEETATGPIASFTDGANNIPAKEIICHINPTETGTGEKSPQNPYVIGGHSEINVTQLGTNWLKADSLTYARPSNIDFGNTEKRTFQDNSYCVGLVSNNYCNTATVEPRISNVSISDNTVIFDCTTAGVYNNIAIPITILKPLETYTLSAILTNVQSNAFAVGFYKADGTFISGYNPVTTFTVPAETKWTLIIIACGSVGTVKAENIMINAGATAIPFSPFVEPTTYNVPFGQTVYGGTLNLTTGVLTINRAREVFDLSDAISQTVVTNYKRCLFSLSSKPVVSNKQKCNIANYLFDFSSDTNHFYCNDSNNRLYLFISKDITELSNIEVVYPLATERTIQLTPTEIKTLLGANNFYHDCNGDIDVTYRANGALYVQEHPITRGLMAARPTEQIQEQEEQQEEKEINKSEDNER